MQSCAGIDCVLKMGAPLPAFHVQAPLMSLPGILKTTLDTVPAAIPYLRADTALIRSWHQKLGWPEQFKIGIVWQGNRRFGQRECVAADQRRSIPLREFEPLGRLANVRLFSLQKGYGTGRRVAWPGGPVKKS